MLFKKKKKQIPSINTYTVLWLGEFSEKIAFTVIWRVFFILIYFSQKQSRNTARR